MAEKLKVLFVASEGVPFAKTGGLADVVGTLPLRPAGVGGRGQGTAPPLRGGETGQDSHHPGSRESGGRPARRPST